MADSYSSAWSSALIAIKEEKSDCEIKLESELVLDDEDQDTPLNVEQQVLQSETAHAVLLGDVFPFEGVSVKLENDPMDDENFKFNLNQDKQNGMISEGNIEFVSCQVTKNEQFIKSEDPLDVRQQVCQEETAHITSSEKYPPFSFEKISVKSEDGIVEERKESRCIGNENIHNDDTMKSSEKRANAANNRKLLENEDPLDVGQPVLPEEAGCRTLSGKDPLFTFANVILEDSLMEKGDFRFNEDQNSHYDDIIQCNRKMEKAASLYPNAANDRKLPENDGNRLFETPASDTCIAHQSSDQTERRNVPAGESRFFSSTERPLVAAVEPAPEHQSTTPDSKPFSCTQCSAQFKRYHDLKRHLLVHSDLKPFSCTECSVQFKCKSDLKRHFRTHSDLKPFLCKQCSARFKRNHDLKIHSVTHSDLQPFSCTQCSTRFKRNHDLTKHLLAHHSDHKPFSCTTCSAQFKRSYHLKMHLLTHTGEKPFSCSQCSAQFKRNSHLKVHLLTHSDQKPFSCSQCSAQFKRNCHLKKHLETHSDLKPFTCPQCSAQFKLERDLKRHLKKHSD